MNNSCASTDGQSHNLFKLTKIGGIQPNFRNIAAHLPEYTTILKTPGIVLFKWPVMTYMNELSNTFQKFENTLIRVFQISVKAL